MLSYAVLALAGWRSLACLRDSESAARTATHLGWFWIWIVVFALRLTEIANDAHLGNGWLTAMIALPLLALFLLVLHRPRWVATPLSDVFADYRGIVIGSQAIVLIGLLGISLFVAGASHPLPWLPILNRSIVPARGFVLLRRGFAMPMRPRHSRKIAPPCSRSQVPLITAARCVPRSSGGVRGRRLAQREPSQTA